MGETTESRTSGVPQGTDPVTSGVVTARRVRVVRSPRMQRYVAWRSRHIGERGPRRVLWRAGVALVGALLIVGGLALVPLPGPGWVIVFVGLGVLATEFAWAERTLRRVRLLVEAWSAWLRSRSRRERAGLCTACLLCVCAALVGLTWLVGTPSWVPDGVPLVR